jgi:hypothetical protein
MSEAPTTRPLTLGLLVQVAGQPDDHWYRIKAVVFDEDSSDWQYHLRGPTGEMMYYVPASKILVAEHTFKSVHDEHVAGSIMIDEEERGTEEMEGSEMDDDMHDLTPHGRLFYERLGEFCEQIAADPDIVLSEKELNDLDATHAMCERRLSGSADDEEEAEIGETNFIST